MHRILCLIAILVLLGLLSGCDEPVAEDPMARLFRQNQELQRQVEAQSRVIFTMGAAVILVGASLAVSLGILLRKGGQTSATTRKAAN